MRTRYRAIIAFVAICTVGLLAFQNCAAKKLPELAENFASNRSQSSVSVQSVQAAPGESIHLTVSLRDIRKSYTLNWQIGPGDGLFEAPTGGSLNVVSGQVSATISLKNKAAAGSGSKSYSVSVSDVGSELSPAVGVIQIIDAGVPSSLAASFASSCASINGVAKCWGYNYHGELSTVDQPNGHRTPEAVVNLAGSVTKIFHSVHETCAIVSGALYCWGLNSYGQLGDGTYVSRRTPAVVPGLESGVTDASIGWFHACAIRASRLYCWGLNNYGQLGLNDYNTRAGASEVTRMGTNVTAVAAGQNFTCAIANGAVKCFGLNNHGQLADGSNVNSAQPVSVVGASAGATTVAAGTYHACAIVNSGVRCWGYNGEGQLGDGTVTSRSAAVEVTGLSSGAMQIAPGDRQTCALVNGVVSCWGYMSTLPGGRGEAMGVGASTPVAITGLRTGTMLLASGPAVSMGASHICAMSMQNEIQCWGYNGYGQLGDGTVTNRSEPGNPISF